MGSGALKAPRCPWAARRPRLLPGALAPSPPRRRSGPGAAPCRTPVGGWRSTRSTRIGNGTTGAPGTSPPATWSGWRGCLCWCAPSRTVRAWPGLPRPLPLAPRPAPGPDRRGRPPPSPGSADGPFPWDTPEDYCCYCYYFYSPCLPLSCGSCEVSLPHKPQQRLLPWS